MKRRILPILLTLSFILSGCGLFTPAETATPTPGATETPTATAVPMALRVNGEGITLEEYNAEISRLQLALTDLGQQMTPEEQKTRVLNNFTDLLLLAQSAVKGGYTIDDATIQSRIDKLITDLGSADQLTAWQTQNNYTDQTFRAELKRELLANWQRDQIINNVTTTGDQIHARQILFQDEANANYAYQLLQDGKDFATLAYEYDPTLGGDLGWFPVGTLTQPNVEEAAFALEPDLYTEVIKSEIGYHIVYLIERDPNHELSVDARRKLQEQALADWIASARAAGTIEILVP